MPLFRPRVVVRRGPGLIGAAARTAVVAGTASAVAGGVRRRQDARARSASAQEAPQIPEPRQETGGLGDDQIARLRQLADLQQQGILTPEEFAAQKAAILGA